MVLSGFWISMTSIHDELDDIFQEWPQYISHTASQCSLRCEVGNIPDRFLMSAMWDIWIFLPSRRWSLLSYYLCSLCRMGIYNKEVIFVKIHGHGGLSFSHLLHWNCLLVFIQQGILCESWREDVPNKYQIYIKRPWSFWIWYCRIFFQEWKWTYDYLWDQAYYVPVLPKYFSIISPQFIRTS